MPYFRSKGTRKNFFTNLTLFRPNWKNATCLHQGNSFTKNIVCRPQSQTISGFKKKRKMPTMILTEAGKNTKNFRYRSYNHIKYIYLLPRHLWEPMKPWHDLGILQSSHHVLSSTSNSALIRVSTGPWSLGLVTRTIVTSVSHFSIVSCPRL